MLIKNFFENVKSVPAMFIAWLTSNGSYLIKDLMISLNEQQHQLHSSNTNTLNHDHHVYYERHLY